MDKRENEALQKDTQQSYLEAKQLNKTTIDAIKEGREIAKDQGMPSSLELEKYNKVTASAIEEGRKIAKDPNVKGYHTVNELKKALES